MKLDKKWTFFSVTAFLFLISLILHFYDLENLPNGFFYDESSIGYNAWSILETGRDEFGTKYPVFFRCFGNYHDPVMIYTLVPLIKIFGLSKFIVRFPSAMYMILASVAFFFLLKTYIKNRWISLLGAFVFSILPWVFVISRSTMSGYTPMLLGIIIGWLFLLKAFGRRLIFAAIISAGGWSFAMYSHNCGRPITAVLLVSFFLLLNVGILKRMRVFAFFSGSLFVFMSPMIISVHSNYHSMTNRFNDISVWKGTSNIGEIIYNIISRYVEYFSPEFLFIVGDTNLRHSTGEAGVLFVFLLPFLILGFFQIFRYCKTNLYLRFLITGFFLYPAAAVLTSDHYHTTRTINGVPFWVLIAFIGVKFCIYRFPPFNFRVGILDKKSLDVSIKQKMMLVIMVIAVTAAVIEVTHYYGDFFSEKGYYNRSRIAFRCELVKSLESCFKNLEEGEVLYISKQISPNKDFKPFDYISILFLGKIKPSLYQKKGIPQSRITQYKGKVDSPGILLIPDSVIFLTKEAIFLKPNPEFLPPKRKLINAKKYSTNIEYQIYRVSP